ncbi:MAG TPA: radical SAM protein [Longimicrobiaceae bacterium]|nr:radical SAM protein [Longimicrobiaceae bacterium]
MKQRSIGAGYFTYALGALRHVGRRRGWFMENLTPGKLWNLLLAGLDFALRREVARAWPVILKVDISPLCNLHCTICVHARPGEGSSDELRGQRFTPSQRMPVDHFRRIAREVSGKTMAVSLYYLGDPLMHPHLDEICGIARDAGLNSHVSSNYSFNLSDERIRSIVESGVTHLTVCVDGLTQETYGRTRVGGRIDRVLDNLERTLRVRRELKRTYPRVEVQYIRYQHNLHEVDAARALCARLGVDQFTEIWGGLHNYADFAVGRYGVGEPRKKGALPQCLWPHFSMLVKFDGGVVPCCGHRIAAQYDPTADARVVGNVLESSVREVWNSAAYRAMRRFSADPGRVRSDPELRESFCDGCPTLFDTDVAGQRKMADTHRWETYYQMDGRGRVSPRRRIALPVITPAAGEPAAGAGVAAE